MPLANGLKLVGLVVLLCLSAWRIGVAVEPALPVGPYDPAYLAAPLLDGVPFDQGVTMPLPPRYRDGQKLLMAGDFQKFFNNECVNQHFDLEIWSCDAIGMSGIGQDPYKIIYEHPYFIIIVSTYINYENIRRIRAHILTFSIYGPPHDLRHVYTIRSHSIGDSTLFDLSAKEIIQVILEDRSMPEFVDGYITLKNLFDFQGYVLWHRDTAGEDAMLAPLSCRQDMDVPCFRAGCDRFPDLCGYAWEMKEKLDLDFEDRNSILRQLGKDGTK